MVIQSLNGVYLHAAWATSANGDDFSLVEFADATYRGTYSDKSSTESTDPISYTWMLIGDIAGADNGTDELEAENTASIATAQAEEAVSQTIVNNNNIQSSQDDTDMSTGNPNELAGTNQGTNNWSASAGLTISAVTDTIYNENDEAVNYLHVECDTAGANYIAFNASLLRAKLAELTEDNSFTLSADIRMSTVFDMPVAVEDTDGSNIQIDFGTIEPELIPVPEETADGLWVYAKSTADCENEVAESSQVLFFDLTNMGVGASLDIANLKVEGGGLATPWKASLDEVAQLANQAYQVAADTEQHFWFTSTGVDTGAHITEKTQADFIADPTNGGGNLLARSNGIALREGMIELATLQQSGLDVNTYDGGGNQINIAHLGYGLGKDSGGTISDAPYYDLGIRAVGVVGNYSVVGGYNNTASGYISHAEGESTTASGRESHAEGYNTTASNTTAHAEGSGTTASGSASHAEGEGTTASGSYSHAEGSYTTASGFNAHAEGYQTKASNYAHAEGRTTEATGYASHAQNQETLAESNSQTALGKFNIADSADTYAVIVGNGTADNARSNALTVDWSGNVEASGDVTDGNGNVLSAMLNASLLGDYVVSRGTSGNWKYIKWASGRVECEGYYTFSSLTFSASGNLYRSSVTAFSIPSGIFSTAPDEGNAWINASGASAYFGAVIGSFSTTGGNCQVWKSTSGNATNVNVHMKLVYRG